MRKPHTEHDDLWDTPIGEHPPLPASPLPSAVDGSRTLLLAGPASDTATGVLDAHDRRLAA